MTSAQSNPRLLRVRLSVLLFLQYAPAGAVIPIFSLRLHELGFSPVETGWACATQSLGTLASPMLAGQAADRWWPAERVLSACALVAGILLWLMANLTAPVAVFVAALAFWFVMAPAMSLGVALCFAHLSDPSRDFSRVRLWGTVGWIVINWLGGWWLASSDWLPALLGFGDRPSELADTFRIGGIFAVTLGVYALTLPRTIPQRTFSDRLAPIAALRLMKSRAMLTYCLCVVGVCLTLPFNSQVTPLFMRDRGIPTADIGPMLTLCQSAEILSLALLPMLQTRLGVKGTLTLGLGACGTAFVVLMAGHPLWLVISSLALHGVCICCFFVAGQVFMNSQARADIRASTQALFNFMIGFGLLVGNLLVGWIREQVAEAFQPTYLVGAVLAVTSLVVFAIGFPPDETRRPEVGRP